MSALDDPEFEVKIRDREPADTIRYDTMEDFTCDQKLANSLICRTEPNKKRLMKKLKIKTDMLSRLSSILSRPRSEGWLHHGRTFSIYLYPLSF